MQFTGICASHMFSKYSSREVSAQTIVCSSHKLTVQLILVRKLSRKTKQQKFVFQNPSPQCQEMLVSLRNTSNKSGNPAWFSHVSSTALIYSPYRCMCTHVSVCLCKILAD